MTTEAAVSDSPGRNGADPARRALICLGALALVLPASCRSVLPQVEGAGVSAAARDGLGAIRAENGLPPLAPDMALERAALEQSGYMAVAGRMDHTALRGRDFASRMRRGGIAPPAAENLAHGRMDLERVFQMWMGSQGHRRNMLDPRFTRYGLAHAADRDGRRYWTLVLGT